jgi:hypothetical protein
MLSFLNFANTCFAEAFSQRAAPGHTSSHAGYPGSQLSKRNQACVSLGGLPGESESLTEAGLLFQENGSRLRDGHAHSFRLGKCFAHFLCQDQRHSESRFTSVTRLGKNPQHARQKPRQVWEAENAAGAGEAPPL